MGTYFYDQIIVAIIELDRPQQRCLFVIPKTHSCNFLSEVCLLKLSIPGLSPRYFSDNFITNAINEVELWIMVADTDQESLIGQLATPILLIVTCYSG